jgi:phenylpropionate dioxygenase-like ring-hydroxylating dioxygenase large terminal subunit
MELNVDPRTLKAWLIAARTDEISAKRITSRTILGQTLVLYRDDAGRAVVLDGRCPHKGVSLAAGTLRKGELQCRYHGWRFNTMGECTHVPSAAPGEALPCAQLQRFPVIEQDGWVWIYWGDAPGSESAERGTPPRYPLHDGYKWFESWREVKAPPHLILENSFDCAHANYVHADLVRTDPVQQVNAKLSETPRGVLISHVEDKGKKSVLARFFPFLNAELRHTEELVLPFTAFVNVYYGGFLHHVTILSCVPVDAETTRVFTRTGVSAGALTWPSFLFFRAITPFVIPQDVDILENQARTLKQYDVTKYGHARQADVPAFWAMRAYRSFLNGTFAKPGAELRTAEVTYKL